MNEPVTGKEFFSSFRLHEPGPLRVAIRVGDESFHSSFPISCLVAPSSMGLSDLDVVFAAVGSNNVNIMSLHLEID